jgi:hypothetical protein
LVCSEACGKSVSVVLIDMHNCSLDDKIRISLGCCSFLSLSLSAYESAILIVIFFL